MSYLHQLDQAARIDELFRYLTNNRDLMREIVESRDPAQTEAVQALADRFCVPYSAIADGVIDTCADAFPEKLIVIDFDGTTAAGIYRVFPANEASEPDCEFKTEFIYGSNDPGDYELQADARAAAQAQARELAALIGGDWATNE